MHAWESLACCIVVTCGPIYGDTHEDNVEARLHAKRRGPRLRASGAAAQVIIVTLYDPVYNQSAAMLAFRVSLVPGQHRGRVADFYRRAARIPGFVTIAERLEDAFQVDNVALFIDNFQSTGLLDPNPVDNTVIPGAPPLPAIAVRSSLHETSRRRTVAGRLRASSSEMDTSS